MSYTHFGKQADVWKHLALCSVMDKESPDVYIETNSAYPIYSLDKTPEREYGIYHFLKEANGNPQLHNSLYYKLENDAFNNNRYIGSPGLAMNILRIANQFIFFDTEKEALVSIEGYAENLDIYQKIKVVNKDSTIGLIELLPLSPHSTLIHIDPYTIYQVGESGYNYLDIFIKASNLGLKCILWYGFNTLDEKKYLNDFIKANLQKCTANSLHCAELIMELIEQKTIPCNPGILGSGLLSSNLPAGSTQAISDYSHSLVDIYKNTSYRNYKGDLYREEIEI